MRSLPRRYSEGSAAKPIVDAEGRHTTDAGGKRRFAPILQWADRDTADRWSLAVVELIRTAHPGALDNGEAA